MIQDCVTQGIGNYERTIVAPRHAETQGSLKAITDAVGGFKDVMSELNGGVKVLKTLGILLTGTVGLGGGIYAVARLFGHS